MKTTDFFKQVFILIAVAIFSGSAMGQALFQKHYGFKQFEESYSIYLNQDSTYSVIGYTNSNHPPDDVYLLKLNPDGTLVWSNSINLLGSERGYSVIQSRDTSGKIDYVCTGDTHVPDALGNGFDDAFLLITDQFGVPTLAETFGDSVKNEHGRCIIESSDSAYVIVGWAPSKCDSTDTMGVRNDVFLIKTDKTGNLIWEENIDIYRGDDYGYKIIQSGNKYIITGYTRQINRTDYDAFLMEVTMAGAVNWVKLYGGTQDDFSYSVKQVDTLGYVLVGHTYSYHLPLVDPDVFVVRTDVSGNVIWKTHYDTPVNAHLNYGRDIYSKDSVFYTTGYSDILGSNQYDMHMIKLNKNGGMLWQRAYGDTLDDRGYSLQVLNDAVVQTGYSYSFSQGKDDVYVVKTNLAGQINCHVRELEINTHYTDSTATAMQHCIVDRQDMHGIEFSYDSMYYQYVVCYHDSSSHDTLFRMAGQENRNPGIEKESKQAEKLKAYPNPVANSGQFTLEFYLGDEDQSAEIRVFDILGRSIMVMNPSWQSGVQKMNISRSQLLPGIYIVQLKTSNKQELLKLVIQ